MFAKLKQAVRRTQSGFDLRQQDDDADLSWLEPPPTRAISPLGIDIGASMSSTELDHR